MYIYHGVFKVSYNQYVNSRAFLWKCQICNEFLKTRNLLNIHKKENHTKEELNSIYSTANKQGTFYCKYCNRISTTKSGNTNHEKCCIENPNRISGKSHSVSEETKQKISKTQSENCRSRIGWNGVLGRDKQSYAESYFDEVLNKNGLIYNKNYHVDKYWLDYAFIDKMIYFEVDGEQHYTEKGLNHDRERTQKLEELGWKCISRIRWSSFSKLDSSSREEVISSLISSIRNSEVYKINYENLCNNKKIRDCSPLIKNGQVNSLGVPVKSMITKEEWDYRKNLILGLNLDTSKYGWKSKAIRMTGLTKRQLENTIKHFPEIFKNNY